MPVVMTGSPGGAIGGASGPAFGSGLAGITSPPKKLFSPSLEVWARRGAEDAAITKERKADYNALKDARLSEDAEKKKAAANAKAAAKAEFAARQKERSDAEAEEKKRMMSYRNEALQKPTLGSIEPSSASKAAPVGESWLWPTAKKHPGVTVKGVGSEHKEVIHRPSLAPFLSLAPSRCSYSYSFAHGRPLFMRPLRFTPPRVSHRKCSPTHGSVCAVSPSVLSSLRPWMRCRATWTRRS
jgi:hypothetical protein